MDAEKRAAVNEFLNALTEPLEKLRATFEAKYPAVRPDDLQEDDDLSLYFGGYTAGFGDGLDCFVRAIQRNQLEELFALPAAEEPGR